MVLMVKAAKIVPANDNLVFSPKDIVMLLSQIEELKHCNIDITSEPDGPSELIVGDYRYHLAD